MAGSNRVRWPIWWGWEIEISAHVFKRMIDRRFSEVDLRCMLEGAMGFRQNHEPGRWTIETLHEGRAWEVIVEPDATDRLVVVITAYPVETA